MPLLDRFRLDDRVALISGGGGAIGSAIGAALASAGAKVVVVDRSEERAQASADRVCAAGGTCMGVYADVTDEADAERIVRQAVEEYGRLDIIVNAVGGGAGKVAVRRREVPARRLGLDLRAQRPQHARRHAVRGSRDDRGRQRRTGAQHLLGPGLPSGSTPVTQRTLRPRGRSARSPGSGQPSGPSTTSPSTRSRPPSSTPRRWRCCWTTQSSRRVSSAGSRSGASGTTDDLVGAALFLCSDASSFVTGQILGIDGGLTATQ